MMTACMTSCSNTQTDTCLMASFSGQPGQITMPAPHHSIFTGQTLVLMPNQQCQSTEGIMTSCSNHHPPHHNRFTALFPAPTGTAGARRKLLLDFMVQGKITKADTPTIWLGATPSGLISDPPPSIPLTSRSNSNEKGGVGPESLPVSPHFSNNWYETIQNLKYRWSCIRTATSQWHGPGCLVHGNCRCLRRLMHCQCRSTKKHHPKISVSNNITTTSCINVNFMEGNLWRTTRTLFMDGRPS